MSFKYISGDFAAAYNDLMEQLEEKQAILDSNYQDAVDNLLDRERERLNDVIEVEFEIGETVLLDNAGAHARVIETGVEFDVIRRDELDAYNNPYYGPGRFYPVRETEDEIVVTCDGALRFYIVEREASEIESDWGHTSVTMKVFPDEISKL